MNSDNYKAVLFDLDGTLIDHFRVIYRCYQYALEHLGLPP
ncbi:MAG: HAD family hydrolase, partial [Puniceicoccaceae bacterium]